MTAYPEPVEPVPLIVPDGTTIAPAAPPHHGTVGATSPPPEPVPLTGSGGELPLTGAEPVAVVAVGVALMAAGTVALLAADVRHLRRGWAGVFAWTIGVWATCGGLIWWAIDR